MPRRIGLLLLALQTLACAHAIKLQFTGEECFWINVLEPEILWGSLVALPNTRGDYPLLDFDVKSSDNADVYHNVAIIEDTFKVFLQHSGKYRFCMRVNRRDEHSWSHEQVSVLWDWNVGEPHSHKMALQKDAGQLTSSLSDVSDQLHRLKAEVKYLQAREERHRQTVNSTHGRVLFYALLRASALVAVSGLQVFCVVKMFSS